EDARILGAQAVGQGGIDKRIDVIAAMIQMRGSVHDLAEVELCYAPQFGAAKDPINVAGMMAANALRVTCRSLTGPTWDEFARGHLKGAVNLPLSELRRQIEEVPRAAGQRAYYAQRLLMQRGLDVKNLSGGFTT